MDESTLTEVAKFLQSNRADDPKIALQEMLDTFYNAAKIDAASYARLMVYADTPGFNPQTN